MAISRVRLFLTAVLLTAPTVARADILSIGYYSGNVGDTATIAVSITGANDVYDFQFDLFFNPNIVRVQSVTEGPFLGTAGSTFFFPGIIDNTAGTVSFIADTLIGAIPGASGEGVLATLQLDYIGWDPNAQIAIDNAVVQDSFLNDVPITVEAGNLDITPEVSSVWLLLAALIGCVLFARYSKVSGRSLRSKWNAR